MEYVFGTTIQNGIEIETVRTKDTQHTNLTGSVTTTREFNNCCTITDSFNIVEHYHSDEDTAGNCYDWYTIDEHAQTEVFTETPEPQEEPSPPQPSETEKLKSEVEELKTKVDVNQEAIDAILLSLAEQEV